MRKAATFNAPYDVTASMATSAIRALIRSIVKVSLVLSGEHQCAGNFQSGERRQLLRRLILPLGLAIHLGTH
jgi:hypothetical protein